MQKAKFILFNKKEKEILFSTEECLIPAGEKIEEIMERFSVKDGKLNTRLKELTPFSKFDFNFPYGLNYTNELLESIKYERSKVLDMCFDQLREEENYASMFLGKLTSLIMSNKGVYGELQDFYLVQNNDLSFVISQIQKGLDEDIYKEDFKYHDGYKELVEYYNNTEFSKDLVLIVNSYDFNLISNLRDLEVIKEKDILLDKNFYKFIEEFNLNLNEDDDDYEFDDGYTADDYVSSYLESKYMTENQEAYNLLIDFILNCDIPNRFAKNIITEAGIKSLKGGQMV